MTYVGHDTSSVTWPFGIAHAITYGCPIVTESLSRAIFEIMGLKDIGGHDLDPSRSRDVIDDVII